MHTFLASSCYLFIVSHLVVLSPQRILVDFLDVLVGFLDVGFTVPAAHEHNLNNVNCCNLSSPDGHKLCRQSSLTLFLTSFLSCPLEWLTSPALLISASCRNLFTCWCFQGHVASSGSCSRGVGPSSSFCCRVELWQYLLFSLRMLMVK